METELTSAVLEKCIDGDTADFKINDQVVKYRFLAIDTPESVHPTKKEEEYGKTASEYTCNALTNAKSIILETETKNKTDKYGRNLAWVWVDNELLQKKLIENGYGQVAYVYGNYKYTLNLCAIQKDAKKEKINVWSNKKYEEGYCATVDTTGVTKEITPPDPNNVNQVQTQTTPVYYYIIIAILLIIILTNKTWRNKIIKQTKNKVNKKINQTITKTINKM